MTTLLTHDAYTSRAWDNAQISRGVARTTLGMDNTWIGGVDVAKSTPCIEWSGRRDDCGYGRTTFRGREAKAHRIAWELANGPIPPGMEVCHRCDNPPCVNADHLWLGTHAENMADSKAKGRARGAPGDRNASRLYPERRPRGSANIRAKLTESDIPVIRERMTAGEAKTSVAREFGVSPSAVRFIELGKTWRHVA